MPTYRKGKKRFFYIHIPRTAGRFIYENIIRNGFQLEQDPFEMMEGIEVAHFPASLYKKYLDVEGIPHIAVIRDPIERYFSLKNYPITVSEESWFMPQVDYLTQKTNVWKLEDGFENDFSEWMGNIIQEDFKVDPLQEYHRHPNEMQHTLDRTSELIDNIRRYYRRDIEQLYPELAAPFEEGT